MRSQYTEKDSLLAVVTDLDLRRSFIPIPGTKAKIVDYDTDGIRYKLIIEYRRNRYRECKIDIYKSMKALRTKIRSYR